MSTKIAFPNNRLAQPALGNPLFVSDVSNNTENLIQAMGILLGLDLTAGFAILQGMVFNGAAYGAGYVFMGNGSVSGNIYYTAGIAVNKYLNPTSTDIDLKIHSDGNNYNTYRVYNAISSDTQIGSFPQFVGNMNTYRLSTYGLKSSLGGAAFLNVGTTAGTVAAGDDSRFTLPTTTDLGLSTEFVYTGWTITINAYKNGHVVIVTFSMSCTSGEQQNQRLLGGTFYPNVPAFGPIYFTLLPTDNTNTSGGFGYIDTSGLIRVTLQNNAITYNGSCTFLT